MKYALKARPSRVLALTVTDDKSRVDKKRISECEVQLDDHGRFLITYREYRHQGSRTILVPSPATGASYAVITDGEETVFHTQTASTDPEPEEEIEPELEPEPEPESEEPVAPVLSLVSSPVQELEEPEDPELIGDLPSLAAEANRWHALAEEHYRSAVICAWHAGRALNAAKSRLRHGDWLPWLAENFAGSRQTADNYRALATNCQRVSNLDPGQSINSALRAIGRKPKPDGEPDSREKPEKDKSGKLTPARRDYLLRELGRLREWLQYVAGPDSPPLDGMSVRDIEGWIVVLIEIIDRIEA